MLASTPLGARRELALTDGMKQLLKKEKIYGFTFEGKRHDAGDKMGFLKATVEFALKRKDLGEEFREYLKTVKLCRAARRSYKFSPAADSSRALSPPGTRHRERRVGALV